MNIKYELMIFFMHFRFKERNEFLMCSLLGPNPKGWGPKDSGCPSGCLSVRHRLFSRLYLCNGWS